MNKVGIAGMAALLTVGIVGCGTTHAQDSSTATSKSRVIAFSTFVLDQYHSAIKAGFEKEASKYGVKLEVESSNNDEATQLAQIESFIQQHVSAVVIAPQNSKSIVTAVEALNKAHIPVFFVDANANPAIMAQDHAHEVEVAESDNFAGGATIGREMIAYYGKKAHIQIGMINFPTDSATQDRDKGFLSVINQYPSYRVVTTLNGDASETTGLSVADSMIEAHPDLNAIFSDTGPAGLGAVSAITSMHKTSQIKVFSFATERPNVEDIIAHTVYVAGAMQQPMVEAETEFPNIIKYLNHHSVPKQVLIPVLGVTKTNAGTLLSKSIG